MDQIQTIRESLLASVSNLTDEQVNQRVEAGKWTIMQVLVHLYQTERLVIKLMTDALAKEENNPTDLKPFHLTLDRTRKIDAPEIIAPSEDFIPLQEMREKLNQSREALNTLISGVSEETLKQKSVPHPVFGLMDLHQWVSFVGVHEQRHTAQIEDLKQLVDQPA